MSFNGRFSNITHMLRGFNGSLDMFIYSVKQGWVPGYKYVSVFAYNPNISATMEDLWEAGGVRAELTAAETYTIASNSNNDTLAGTGARTLIVQGCDGAGMEIEETINLNGQNPVVTVNSYLPFTFAQVDDVGATGYNEGDITIDPTISGAGSRQGFIAAEKGRTRLSHFTIPANYSGTLVYNSFGVQRTAAQERGAVFQRMTRKGPGKSLVIGGDWSVQTDGVGLTDEMDELELYQLDPMEYIKYQAIASGNNTAVFVRYGILLRRIS